MLAGLDLTIDAGGNAMKTITAIYENGLFRPSGPVDLPEGCVVRIVLDQPATPCEDARKRVFEHLSASFETGDAEAAARHN
jgi:predicted DNA-binding antitoxin AbrB/MazE fold protein